MYVMDKRLTIPATAVGFGLLHVALLLVPFVAFRPSLVGWAVVSYLVRMLGVTAGYHRYFSHRSFKLGRVAQLLLAILAQTSGQKGVLWWAAHHRDHHRHADRDRDVHTPRRGFWWAHAGWILSDQFDDYDPRRIADFGRYPELRWLDRFHWLPTAVFGAATYVIGGWPGFVWGYVVATVCLYHGTFAINSIAHLWGTRTFETADDSRNNFWLAVITLGEGWHNNHHHCMSSARQGIRWWEFDPTYLVLRLFAATGLVRDLRPFVVRTTKHVASRHAA